MKILSFSSNRLFLAPSLGETNPFSIMNSISNKIVGESASSYIIAKTASNSAFNPSLAPFQILASRYMVSLDTFPVRTSMVTGGALALLGDLIAQKSNTSSSKYDRARAVGFVSFDVVYRAIQCILFPHIVRIFNGSSLASIPGIGMNLRTSAVLEQTAVNQFIVIPFLYYPVFFTLMGFLQGVPINTTMTRAKDTLMSLLKRNWLFWIPVQCFQFGCIQKKLQIPFLCVAGLLWTIILSASVASSQK
eukprot:745642_1